MFQRSLRVDSGAAAPLLSSSEPNDRLPHLVCARPPPGLLDLLQPFPKHMIVEPDNDPNTIALRHPGDVIGLSLHTVDDLWYYMDVYQLLSQRRIKRVCLPSKNDSNISFFYTYTCCQEDCNFQLCYRRAKKFSLSVSARQQCELILPTEDNPATPGEYPQSHSCEAHSEWNTDMISSVADASKASGYCVSTALMDAIVTRYLLIERRQQRIMEHVENYLDRVQQSLGLHIPRQRFLHACSLFGQIEQAWPKYKDEDASICDSVFGLWSVRNQTKGLPRTMIRFLSAGPKPVMDPISPLWKNGIISLYYYTRSVLLVLGFGLLLYPFACLLGLAMGSILVAGGIRGAAYWNRRVETIQNSSSVTEFSGWVSDRYEPLSGWSLLGLIYGRKHGARTYVNYQEADGADFSHEFINVSRFDTNGLDQSVDVPMIRLAEESEWSHAYPSRAFTKKHSLWHRLCHAGLGVFLWAYFFVIFELQQTVWGGIFYALLQLLFLWTSWVCPPPTRPWEGLSKSISPKGCQDWFWTINQVLVFRMWAIQLPKQPKGSLQKPFRSARVLNATATEESHASLRSDEAV
eukprot:scaffold9178_cov176-Amphora_coffeaeformis.AAC.9